MKFSELTTENGLDVLCEIAPCIGNIAVDDELLAIVKKKAKLSDNPTEAEIKAIGLGNILALLPIVLKKHRADVYGILAALNGKTAEEIAEQNVIVTVKQIRDVISDEGFRSFFKSSSAQDATA